MNVAKEIKHFFEPRSVALLGVSRLTGKGKFNILENLLSYGYQGKIYPVNPKASEILGVPTYSRIVDVSDQVDLAIINLPRSLVPGIVQECVEQGIHSIIIVTQGFTDAGDEEGRQLQKGLDKFIKMNGVRILGPNSLGTVNTFARFSSSFAEMPMTQLPVSIICQTGVFFEWPESLLIGKGIDLGNVCDVNFVDSLEYFEQDDETKVIVLHIEGMRNGKKFLEVAGRTAREKPIITLKTGKSEYAAEVARSHTGSLVGSDEIWSTALKQSGLIRITDIGELSDLARAFSLLPPMKGRRVGIVSSSGGFNIISIDACQKYDLEIAKLSPVTMKRINSLSPSWQSIGNPADMWPAHMVLKQPVTEVVIETLDAMLSDHKVDAAFLIWYMYTDQVCTDLSQLLAELAERHHDKPLVCFFYGDYVAGAKDRLKATSGITVFDSPDQAIRALGRLAQYSSIRRSF